MDPVRVLDAWRPTAPKITNGSDGRSAARYLAVVKQFDVEENKRYKPSPTGATACNIYCTDVTAAMAAPIPHWLFKTELNANATVDWLLASPHGGSDYGWMECSSIEAHNAANNGFPTVVAWKNPTGIGHIAVVIPSSQPGVRIAQAGGANFFDRGVVAGFGTRVVRYFTHG